MVSAKGDGFACGIQTRNPTVVITSQVQIPVPSRWRARRSASRTSSPHSSRSQGTESVLQINRKIAILGERTKCEKKYSAISLNLYTYYVNTSLGGDILYVIIIKQADMPDL